MSIITNFGTTHDIRPGMIVCSAIPKNGNDLQIPSGSLYCNGSAISRTYYENLFRMIGITYGDGDGSTTFNIPDLRGPFIRSCNDTQTIGTKQTSSLGPHTHNAVCSDTTVTGGVRLDGGEHSHPLIQYVNNYVLYEYDTLKLKCSALINPVTATTVNPTTNITTSDVGSEHIHTGDVNLNPHKHDITISSSGDSIDTETRPDCIIMRPLIKY